MKTVLLKLTICFTICFASITSYGQNVPVPEAGTYVNDKAQVLTVGQLAALNEKLYKLEKTYNIQMAIIALSGLPANTAIEDYAREIGRQWHVGNDRRGLVYVLAISDRKQRYEVSSKLEGVFTDISTHRITDMMKPFLKDKNYFAAFNLLIDQTFILADQDQQENKKAASPAGVKSEPVPQIDGEAIAGYLIFFVLGWLVLAFWIRTYRKAKQDKREAADRLRKETEKKFIAYKHDNRKQYSSCSNREAVAIASCNTLDSEELQALTEKYKGRQVVVTNNAIFNRHPFNIGETITVRKIYSSYVEAENALYIGPIYYPHISLPGIVSDEQIALNKTEWEEKLRMKQESDYRKQLELESEIAKRKAHEQENKSTGSYNSGYNSLSSYGAGNSDSSSSSSYDSGSSSSSSYDSGSSSSSSSDYGNWGSSDSGSSSSSYDSGFSGGGSSNDF